MGVVHTQCSQKQLIMGKGQNEEGGFSEEQVQMYKDCFKLMDINKDGTLDKNDLRGAFDNIGVLMSESELDDLMGEVGGPAPSRAWLTCSRARWPETATTPTSSSSRLSLPTTRAVRSTTFSTSSRWMRTICARLRRFWVCLWLLRRRRRRSKRRSRLLRRPLRRKREMLRRRRRRRRRPPSK